MPGTARPHWTLTAALLAICGASFCVAGCGSRDYYKDPPETPEPLTAEAPPQVPPVQLNAGVTEPVRSDVPLVPSTREITMNPRKPKDKIDKADLYWKLFYLARTEGAIRPPDSVRRQISGTLDDAAKALLNQILAALDRAHEAYLVRRRPGRPGAFTDDLPWGGSRSEFEKALAPAPDETGSAITNTRQKKAIEDFNSRYQLPPEMIRANAVQEAKTLIDELLRALNEDRKADGDYPLDPKAAGSSFGLSDLKITPPSGSTGPNDLVIPPP